MNVDIHQPPDKHTPEEILEKLGKLDPKKREEIMNNRIQHVGEVRGRKEGIKLGRTEGIKLGEAKGKKEGIKLGRQEMLQQMYLDKVISEKQYQEMLGELEQSIND